MKDLQTADRALADGLRAIAEEDAHLSASPAVEAQVMAAFDAVAIARRRRTRAIVAALGAAAVLAAAIAVFRPRQTADFGPGTSNVVQTSSGEVTTAFLPLAYSGVPIVNGHVVRMEVPRASLVSFGLVPADAAEDGPGASSGTVLADVVVGDDGLARAVRFVRRSVRKETQR
jgi:hypothetical protein